MAQRILEEVIRMQTKRNRCFAAVAGVLLVALAGAFGCESQGPAARVGESIDKGVRDAKDAINPPGPAEKAGRAVDDALKR